jgi:hypothetical protein
MKGNPMIKKSSNEDLLKLLGGKSDPTPDQLRDLICCIDSHKVLAKVFILEGVPHVFAQSPMKYVIFREQVAERFNIGSQDVCIVGSAKLGFSPSAHGFGKLFSETSDVDVVIISDSLFYDGSKALFSVLNLIEPSLNTIRPFVFGEAKSQEKTPIVDLRNWKMFKEAARNFVYENFNPGVLPKNNPLRNDIFNKISSTAGLFLALEPKVFVSKIRCRVFRNWKSAEEYYANSLREARDFFVDHEPPEEEIDDSEQVKQSKEMPKEKPPC